MPETSEPEQLPIIDLHGLIFDDATCREIAAKLDSVFRDVGFCYVTNTGVDFSLVDEVFAASQRFHDLPREEKQSISINQFHRGYIAPQSSQIRGSTIEAATRPNLSESFIMLQEVDPDNPTYGQPLQGPNQWPGNYPEFKNIISRYHDSMTAMALALPGDYFDQHFEKPTSWLRLLHYPPQPPESPGDQFGSAPHTDHGFITLLAQDGIGGLARMFHQQPRSLQ